MERLWRDHRKVRYSVVFCVVMSDSGSMGGQLRARRWDGGVVEIVRLGLVGGRGGVV